jgi:preprotein translocase subunit SecG
MTMLFESLHSMFTFLLVVHAIIAAALVAVILMQRSEGGGLGMGGSPTGLMSARGAADFLTRATTILATLFVLMSIGLAVLASVQHGPREIDTSLSRRPGAAGALGVPPAAAPGTGVPLADDPLAGVAASAGGNATLPNVPTVPAGTAAGATPPAAATARPATSTTTPATTSRPDRTAREPRPAARAAGNDASPAPSANSSSAPSASAPATTPQPPANSSPGTTNANSSGPQQ